MYSSLRICPAFFRGIKHSHPHAHFLPPKNAGPPSLIQTDSMWLMNSPSVAGIRRVSRKPPFLSSWMKACISPYLAAEKNREWQGYRLSLTGEVSPTKSSVFSGWNIVIDIITYNCIKAFNQKIQWCRISLHEYDHRNGHCKSSKSCLTIPCRHIKIKLMAYNIFRKFNFI